MSQDWDIKKRADACMKTGDGFGDGQRYVSRLTFGAEGYVREDFAEEVWDQSMAEGALSVWRSTFRLPPPPPAEPMKKETVESMLRQFMNKEDYSRKNAIYILAVMLERKRLLVERDVQERDDGTKVRVYEHRHTGETFVVPDPELKLSELEHVQEEVIALLEGREPGEPAADEEPVALLDDAAGDAATRS